MPLVELGLRLFPGRNLSGRARGRRCRLATRRAKLVGSGPGHLFRDGLGRLLELANPLAQTAPEFGQLGRPEYEQGCNHDQKQFTEAEILQEG